MGILRNMSRVRSITDAKRKMERDGVGEGEREESLSYNIVFVCLEPRIPRGMSFILHIASVDGNEYRARLRVTRGS